MSEPITRATIANWALVDIGIPPNYSIDEGDGDDTLGQHVDLLWQRVVDRCFGLHDWTFCRRTFLLVKKDAAPVTGYPYAFALPDGRVGDPLKISTDPQCTQALRDYHIEGDELHARSTAIYLRSRVMVDPQYWDPAFRAAFVTAFAGYLAIPCLQDIDMKASKLAEAFGTPSQGGAGGEFGRLIAQNRAAQPMPSPTDAPDPLVSARFM